MDERNGSICPMAELIELDAEGFFSAPEDAEEHIFTLDGTEV